MHKALFVLALFCFSQSFLAAQCSDGSRPLDTARSADASEPIDSRNAPANSKSNALSWEQYLAVGDQAHSKGNGNRAKQYYLEALTKLEQVAPERNELTMDVAKLERQLLRLYPNLVQLQSGEIAQIEPKDLQEENALLMRLDRINRVYPSSSNALALVVRSQLLCAQKEIEKRKETADKKKSTQDGRNKQ
jgi:hypothetical protein